jgi:hypothetical protein
MGKKVNRFIHNNFASENTPFFWKTTSLKGKAVKSSQKHSKNHSKEQHTMSTTKQDNKKRKSDNNDDSNSEEPGKSPRTELVHEDALH